MFRKRAIAAGFALVMTVPAHAEFRWEVGADYLTGDLDNDSIDADIDVIGINGSWFFSPVDTARGPLAEAAFLDRASRVDVDINDGELDFDVDDADITGYGIGTRWVFDRDSGWLVDVAARLDEVEDEEIESFTIGGGKYLFENTLVTVFYTYSDTDSFGDTDTYGVNGEHWMEAPLGSVKFEAGYAYADTGDNNDTDNYVGRVTYYPLNSVGIGGEWERIVSGGGSDNWSVFAEWFITEGIALSAQYQDSERTQGISDIDGDAVLVGARFRF